MYKGSSASASGGKLKMTSGKGASASGPGGSGGIGGSKHVSAKRRTSSEDSSLEPDMAELSLDDGCNLALGAEASNTFEFLPPAQEMLLSLSPLLRESRKYGGNNGGSKMSETKSVSLNSTALPGAEPSPTCFASKDTVIVVMDKPSAEDKEAKLEAESDLNGDEDAESAGSNRPSNSAAAATISDSAPKSTEALCGQAEDGPAGVAGSGAAAVDGAGSQDAAAAPPVPAAAGEALCEDDYQAYYLSAASEEGADRQLAENNQEEEPDIFAGIKPLDQEGRMEVRQNTLIIIITFVLFM